MSFQYLFEHSPLLLFVFARVVALVFTAPLLNSGAIPAMVKAGLSLAVAIVAIPHLVQNGYTFPDSPGYFLLLLLGEALIGITMGLILQLYFAVFQLAGQLFTTQIGFAASQVFDPMGEVSLPLTGQFFNMAAMYLFLSLDGLNKLFFNGVYLSFIKVSPQSLFNSADFLNDFFIGSLGMIFYYSMQIAIPIMATLMICSVTMGLLAKAAPQMNLLMLGFPINIMVGFTILILLFPSMFHFFENIIGASFTQIRGFFMAVAGEAV